jgi:hypothetical protein
MRRQRFKGSSEVTRNYGNICFRDDHAETMFERGHHAVATARAFGKNDEDAFFFAQLAPELGESMWSTIFSPHRQRIKGDCRKNTGRATLKENVSGSNRKRFFTVARRKRGNQGDRIEMAAVICREHERTASREVFSSFNRQTMRAGKIDSHYQKAEVVSETLEQSAFAADTAEALCGG